MPEWLKLLEDKDKGPWFTASFGAGETSCCGMEIETGHEIRADGDGGWECRACAE